jgi:hypothetical protein
MSAKPSDRIEPKRWSACIDLLCQPLEKLDAVQRLAALAFHYDGNVRNGGHSSHFDSPNATHDDELIQGLRNMEAREQARILAEARILNREANKAKEGEQEPLWEMIADLDQKFYRVRPNIEEILVKYFDANKTHFPK